MKGPGMTGLLLVGMLAAVTFGAWAHADAKRESPRAEKEHAARLVEKAHFTLAQAVETALQQTPGRAFQAELEQEDGTLAYEIKIARTDQTCATVRVDADSGKILASEDQEDQDSRKGCSEQQEENGEEEE